MSEILCSKCGKPINYNGSIHYFTMKDNSGKVLGYLGEKCGCGKKWDNYAKKYCVKRDGKKGDIYHFSSANEAKYIFNKFIGKREHFVLR